MLLSQPLAEPLAQELVPQSLHTCKLLLPLPASGLLYFTFASFGTAIGTTTLAPSLPAWEAIGNCRSPREASATAKSLLLTPTFIPAACETRNVNSFSLKLLTCESEGAAWQEQLGLSLGLRQGGACR